MPRSQETTSSRSRDKRRSRSRSRSREYKDRKHEKDSRRRSRSPPRSKWESDAPIKNERVSPDRRVKQEPTSPSRRRNDDKHTQRYEGRDARPDRGRYNQDHYRGDRQRNDQRRLDKRRQRDDVDDSQYTFGKKEDVKEDAVKEEDKDKPNFGLSGKLADDTNTFRGVVVKYNEPPEARKPKLKWRLYPFKGDEALPVLHIHRQSGYLIGRDRKVADIPVDHPSCSKQHAVLQFRSVKYTREDGTEGRRTRPYIIDLGSANGTFVNNKQIEPQRYMELIEKDTIKFGFSSRDYVILHDNVDVEEKSDEEA